MGRFVEIICYLNLFSVIEKWYIAPFLLGCTCRIFVFVSQKLANDFPNMVESWMFWPIRKTQSYLAQFFLTSQWNKFHFGQITRYCTLYHALDHSLLKRLKWFIYNKLYKRWMAAVTLFKDQKMALSSFKNWKPYPWRWSWSLSRSIRSLRAKNNIHNLISIGL